MRVRVAVVALGEVAVEGGDDGVLALGVIAVAGPLPDAGTAGVGQHHPAHVFKRFELTIAGHREAHLLRAGGDGELAFDLELLVHSLACQGSRAVQVFVR